MISGERLARQLRRLLAKRRFGPMVLRLHDGRRVPIRRPNDVCVDLASGTITVTTLEAECEVLFEELVAIELRRCASTEATRS